MRLIDADVTTKTYTADLFDTLDDFERVNDILEYAPTVDAVSIVRCKDCKYHDEGENFIYCWALQMKCPNDSEFFCKYGKREEKNTNASN